MPEAHNRIYRHPKYKTAYRVRNWAIYEASLRNRGNIEFWINDDALDTWTPPQNGKRGAQRRYSVLTIETALTLRLVFHLACRARRQRPTVPSARPLATRSGTVGSILKLMDLDRQS